MMIYKSTSKIDTTKLLLSFSNLDEIDKISEIDGVQIMRVSKIVFDPESTNEERHLDVDGERAPYQKMEVEVMPLSINVIASDGQTALIPGPGYQLIDLVCHRAAYVGFGQSDKSLLRKTSRIKPGD